MPDPEVELVRGPVNEIQLKVQKDIACCTLSFTYSNHNPEQFLEKLKALLDLFQDEFNSKI